MELCVHTRAISLHCFQDNIFLNIKTIMTQNRMPFSVARPTSEQRKEALALLKNEFLSLFTGPNHPLHWTGTRTQLFELAYLVYMEDLLLTDDGRPLTLRAITSLACLRFGQQPTTNPCAYLYKSRARKEVRSQTFFDSYAHLFINGEQRPLTHFYTQD